MDFNARQYDPQTGRFLSIDPLAAEGGQDKYSPYAAMGNNPAMMIDPDGMRFMLSGASPMNDPFTESELQNLARLQMDFAKLVNGTIFVGGGNGGGGGMSSMFGNWSGGASGIMGYLVADLLYSYLSSSMGLYQAESTFASNFGDKEDELYACEGCKSLKNTKVILHDRVQEDKGSGWNKTTFYGVGLELVYTGNVSAYDKVEWIQTITSNNPGGLNPSGKPYIDVGGYNDEDKRPPFYFPHGDLREVKRRGNYYGGLYYKDSPLRALNSQLKNQSTYVIVETALIGYKNGKWHFITGYQWGYTLYESNKVNVNTIQQMDAATNSIQRIINQLNNR